MILKMAHILTTRTITEQDAWIFLDWFLDCFGRHGISEVALIYGYDWGNEIYNWKDQIVRVTEVGNHIKNVEAKELGWLGYNDLYLKAGDRVQIQFCHHEELHLGYNQRDDPLVTELIVYFGGAIGLKQ